MEAGADEETAAAAAAAALLAAAAEVDRMDAGSDAVERTEGAEEERMVGVERVAEHTADVEAAKRQRAGRAPVRGGAHQRQKPGTSDAGVAPDIKHLERGAPRSDCCESSVA